MKTPQQVWEEAYPDRRKWEALDQDTRDEWERVVRVAQIDLSLEVSRLDYELILRDNEHYKSCMKSAEERDYPSTGFWRLLTDGEWRLLGDQAYFAPMGGWVPLSSVDIGQQNTNGHYKLPVRRWVGPKLNTTLP